MGPSFKLSAGFGSNGTGAWSKTLNVDYSVHIQLGLHYGGAGTSNYGMQSLTAQLPRQVNHTGLMFELLWVSFFQPKVLITVL